MQEENKNKVAGPVLRSSIYRLRLPLSAGKDTSKIFSIFKGFTGDMIELSCHASFLASGYSPHNLHTHKEEELLIVLSGSIDIMLTDGSVNVKKGQFIFYPSGIPHTIIATGKKPANYLVFKWSSVSKKNSQDILFGTFKIPDQDACKTEENFGRIDIIETQTLFLKKLHCHISTARPGAGYEPHCDYYNVAILVLEGQLETLDKEAAAYDIIFYASGEPHGIQNPFDDTVRYLVFEFHAYNRIYKDIFILIASFIRKATDPERWKRKLKKIFKL